ncbi:MAG TPA: hypothetical protein VIJ40_06405 [Acidimicrobiales bacterium]
MKRQTPSLLPVLRSQAQGELLALLYLHPGEQYSLTEISRQLGISVRMVHYDATGLIAAGLIRDARVGNVRLLRAETESPLFRPLSDLLAVTFGPMPIMSDLLRDIEGISEAYIYGSWAARYRGESGRVPADVDVLVVGNVNKNLLYEKEREAESRLLRPVNIRLIGESVWNDPDEKNTFVASLRSRPLVKLGIGEDSV